MSQSQQRAAVSTSRPRDHSVSLDDDYDLGEHGIVNGHGDHRLVELEASDRVADALLQSHGSSVSMQSLGPGALGTSTASTATSTASTSSTARKFRPASSLLGNRRVASDYRLLGGRSRKRGAGLGTARAGVEGGLSPSDPLRYVHGPGQFPYGFMGLGHPGSSPFERRSAVSTRRVGLRRHQVSLALVDPFHTIVNWPWWRVILFLSCAYLASWFLFGLFYHVCAADGCLAGDGIQKKGSAFGDNSIWTSFFFSVETMTTIGFGDMYPRTPYANIVFLVESLCGIFLDAACIGIIFTKFGRATARASSIVFTSSCIIGPRNGVESLSFRIANTRKHQLIEAHISLFVSYPERTTEGELCYRFDRLETEDIGPFLSSTPTTVVHTIDETSPFYENSRLLERAELVVLLEGIDSTTSDTTQARHSYVQSDVMYQARFSDMLSFENGVVTVDMHEFNRTLPIAPSRFSVARSRLPTADYDSESD